MPKWNQPQGYTIHRGKDEEPIRIQMGQTVEEEFVTPEFMGGNFGRLREVSQSDLAKYEQWKRENPKLADRWAHIESSPTEFQAMLDLERDAEAMRAPKGKGGGNAS